MMRRKTQRTALNASIFGVAILLILYLSQPESNKRTFAWTTIRYQTTAATLPQPRGVCPGLAGTSKPALVVSRVQADGSSQWLDTLSDLYHVCPYTADAPIDPTTTNLQVPENRGHEAMAYLTFIIDNYANIPAAGAVFVHGSRWAWHNDAPDYDNAALLAALNVSAALGPSGYHNLRCDWSASTCSLKEAKPQGSLETSLRAMLEPQNSRAMSDAALPRTLGVLFGGIQPAGQGGTVGQAASINSKGDLILGRYNAVRAQCCAQFVVAQDRIWQHSYDEYVALRQWLLDGSKATGNNKRSRSIDVAPEDDRVAGRILSYLWHILFMQASDRSVEGSATSTSLGVNLERLNALACPRADECYCRLYGRCDLKGCTTPGRCVGQYRVPPNFRLPADWAETHS